MSLDRHRKDVNSGHFDAELARSRAIYLYIIHFNTILHLFRFIEVLLGLYHFFSVRYTGYRDFVIRRLRKYGIL